MTHRVFIIGDVHGMTEELDLLLRQVGPSVRLGFVGDLVDKGPDSLGVLRRVREELQRRPGSSCISGNHEESSLRLWEKFLKGGTWSGIAKVEKEPWLTQGTREDFEFIRSMPLFVRPFGDRGTLMVHGGLFPSYFDKYPGLPELSEGWQKGGGKQMDRARRFLRVRHVHRETGEMVTFGEEGDHSQPWTERYDGREGFVFYGHDPQRTGVPLVGPHSIGLDTGCVFGGPLTGVMVEDGRVVDTISVSTGRKFREWLEPTSEE